MAGTSSVLTDSSVVAAGSEYLSTKSNSSEKKDDLGKDAFMQMLVTQMKYQDPLNPMDNQQMLAQLAQFTALEQMKNVANASEKQLANSMIGKYVEYQYKDETTGKTTMKTGKVDYVKLTANTPTLGIGKEEVTLDKVSQVLGADMVPESSSAFDVIGKTVQAKIKEKNEKGVEVDAIIEGEVKSIQMISGKPNVVIGTGKLQKSIPYSDVLNVVTNPSITGREVKGTIKDSNGNKQTINGRVDYIKILSDATYVCVNDQWVDFNDIEDIKDIVSSNTSEYDIIGKTVRVTTTEKDAQGKDQSVVVEGMVKQIQMVSGKPYVLIGTGSTQISFPYANIESTSQSSNIIGREVKANSVDSEGNTREITGVVDSVKTISNDVFVSINGEWVDQKKVEFIK